MVVGIQRRVLPVAVENVGVNGYVSEHGNHQPNVTNLQEFARSFWKEFGVRKFAVSVRNKNSMEKNKNKSFSSDFLIIEKLIKIGLQRID